MNRIDSQEQTPPHILGDPLMPPHHLFDLDDPDTFFVLQNPVIPPPVNVKKFRDEASLGPEAVESLQALVSGSEAADLPYEPTEAIELHEVGPLNLPKPIEEKLRISDRLRHLGGETLRSLRDPVNWALGKNHEAGTHPYEVLK